MKNNSLIAVLVALSVVRLSVGDALTGHGIKGNKNLNPIVMGDDTGTGSNCYYCQFCNACSVYGGICLICGAGSEEEGEESLNINLDTPQVAELKSSMLFKKPKTIILETSKKCMVGNADIQIYDGKIFVFDEMGAKSLYVFDMDGKFIQKIGEYGRGPGEYTRISDFTIDKTNNVIYLLDGNRIHRYRINGTYISSSTLEITNASVWAIQYYNGMIYAEALPYKSNKNDIDLLWRFKPETGKKIDSFLKSSDFTFGWNELLSLGHRHFFGRLGEQPKYVHYLMNTVISVEDFTPYIRIESKNFIKKRDVEGIIKEPDYFEKISKLTNIDRIFDINGYVESKNFIFFTYCGSPKKVGSVFHDFTTNQTLHLKYLKNDLLFKDETMRSNFGFYDSSGAYMMINAYEVFEEVEKNNIVSNLDKKEQLLKLKEDDNPVIFYYEFKDAK